MAELEMQEYEQLNRNEETTYDEIKVDKMTIEMSQLFKTGVLVIIVSLFSAGVISTVVYVTVYAQLQQKFDLINIKLENIDRKMANINTKLTDIERINQMILQDADIQMHTLLDNNTMCYSGETWQRLNDSNKCLCAAGFLGKQCKYSDGKDTSFMVLFHEGYQDVPLIPKILVASANTARLSVLYFSTNTNHSTTIDTTNTAYNLSNSVLPSDGIHLAGLSHTSDLSGTLVTASKPVIVVSGNRCNFAVADNIRVGYCQPFIESVLPTNQLDYIFITPHLSKRLNNTVRIQAVNSTKLTIKIENRKISKTLNARDYWDFYYNTTAFIFASEDILVMSYPHGLNEHKGDPFMMTIPGVNQYLYEYDFVVPTGFDSFISITVQSDAVDGFMLDRNSSNIKSLFCLSEGMNHFSTFSLPISAGYHHIDHKKKVRFGLWVYGNKYPDDGYGYPAGMAYKT
ncbi:unnamed protein product [Mytilus edulis]|uniref:IgGFc-binding protein N-terminal domain-containing protein n=1 Tax=Mytilus edulis TaxID=6550 RepID=A0A8S3Q157_MYTED|nr:unnamed protein product [Mytilus edulis]